MSKKKFSLVKKLFVWFCSIVGPAVILGQTAILQGRISSGYQMLQGATVSLQPLSKSAISNINGQYKIEFLPFGNYQFLATAVGYQPLQVRLEINRDKIQFNVELIQQPSLLEQVVVSGTMKPVARSASPVPVEVYTPQFLKKNPTPNLFEALQLVNGVRPQINCNVCNTGDIHINGLEGPYTMVTIDGMPIVSSLASVYGLFGIPNQLIDRIEIVKGPASSLYGSEAVGGLINVITKNPLKAPKLAVDIMATSWQEYSADLGLKFKPFSKTNVLLGLNYFNYLHPKDKNNDGFTDLALQHRISIFNKWMWQRKENRIATIAWRYFYEGRWGGDIRWNNSFRGGDSLYGESIYTNRLELMGNYQLPIKEKLVISYSYNYHHQDSYYGRVAYNARQQVAFSQLSWEKNISERHQLLAGAALRFTYYDDNSTATLDTLTLSNKPDQILLPGFFLQDEVKLNQSQQLLLGARLDHHPIHGYIFTPRLAYKWNINTYNILRLNAGTGFRVVNLFTEEHAALTGSRAVIVKEHLQPERSLNFNLNWVSKIPMENSFLGIDGSAWYTYFSNQIIPDYLTNPSQIIYSNLDGYASSKGISLNLDYNFSNRFKALIGGTLQNVHRIEKKGNGKEVSIQPLFTERWSATWLFSYALSEYGIAFDYTGNIYGPMQLPLLNELDPRQRNSPVWSIQNFQCTKKLGHNAELYGGIKNLLNWTPVRGNPFIIARSRDPFNKMVEYDPNGRPKVTAENPYALSFDPAYVYAPNQGRRIFLGFRYNFNQ